MTQISLVRSSNAAKEKMLSDNYVWERRGADEISRNLRNLIFALTTILGLVLTALGAYYSSRWLNYSPELGYTYTGPDYQVLGLVVMVLAMAGGIIAALNDKPAISFGGFLLVAIPFGVYLGPIFAMYTGESIIKVLFITGMVVVVFGVVGAVIPDSLEGFWSVLLGGSTILLIGLFGLRVALWLGIPLPYEATLSVIDWIGVVLFSGYIMFDINRMKFIPCTVDNAIDSALAVYLDIINLVLFFLGIAGKRKDQS